MGYWHITVEYLLFKTYSSLMAQKIKNLHAMKEMQVQDLGGEDPLEKELATQSSILPG